jgi:hypothetical protein
MISRQNSGMTQLADLTDEDLMTRARAWRLQALQGVAHARRVAREYEFEVRRRFREATTISDALDTSPSPLRPYWFMW